MAPGHDHLDCYPCLQLNSRAVLTYIHLRHRCPETPAWLLFIDTRQTPLSYFHQLLLALGISPHAIAGLAYTTNGGQFSDPLQHATNILLQLSNQQDWYSSTATKCINHGTIVTTHRSLRVAKPNPRGHPHHYNYSQACSRYQNIMRLLKDHYTWSTMSTSSVFHLQHGIHLPYRHPLALPMHRRPQHGQPRLPSPNIHQLTWTWSLPLHLRTAMLSCSMRTLLDKAEHYWIVLKPISSKFSHMTPSILRNIMRKYAPTLPPPTLRLTRLPCHRH